MVGRGSRNINRLCVEANAKRVIMSGSTANFAKREMRRNIRVASAQVR